MILSVLQFCMMSMAEAQVQAVSHHEMMAEVAALAEHGCCSASAHDAETPEVVCPDCEKSDSALPFSSASDIKPLFSLLYLTVQHLLDAPLQTRIWQVFIESDILSAQPKIYLANVSFLE